MQTTEAGGTGKRGNEMNVKIKIEVACDHPESTQFVAWLNTAGYDATVGRATSGSVDGVSESNDAVADEIMAMLWGAYRSASASSLEAESKKIIGAQPASIPSSQIRKILDLARAAGFPSVSFRMGGPFRSIGSDKAFDHFLSVRVLVSCYDVGFVEDGSGMISGVYADPEKILAAMIETARENAM